MVWGIIPSKLTTDSWYYSQKNLNFFKEKGLSGLVGIAKNRLVKEEGGHWTNVEKIEIPPSGKNVILKQVGLVKVFALTFRNGKTKYWIWFLGSFEQNHPVDESTLEEITRADFRELFSIHWGIESYHRAIKQLCNIGKFMVRKAEAVRTHFFLLVVHN